MKFSSTEVSKATKLVSIADLRDRDFSGIELSSDERQALTRFDAYRISYLNASETEEIFHKRYQELQAKAMLAPWSTFLDDSFAVEDEDALALRKKFSVLQP